MADEPLKPAGLGPDAVDTEARSYFEIALEDQRRELAHASMGRFGAEAKPPLPVGQVPALPAGSPWSAPDPFGPEPPLGQDINGADPSGTEKNRGVI